MLDRKILSTTFFIVMILSFLVVTTVQPVRAQFVLSSWDYPDEYGRGIYGFFIDENSTGVFLSIGGPIIISTNDTLFEFDAGYSIELDVRATVNYTYLGLSHPADIELGRNWFTLHVLVTSGGQTIFSQTNFTPSISGLVETDIWYFSEEVILNFLFEAGQIYTVVVIYEVYE